MGHMYVDAAEHCLGIKLLWEIQIPRATDSFFPCLCVCPIYFCNFLYYVDKQNFFETLKINFEKICKEIEVLLKKFKTLTVKKNPKKFEIYHL